MHNDPIKKALALAALNYLKEGMVIGLGSGTTVFSFLKQLAKKIEEGFSITCVASSNQTYEKAYLLQIPLVSINDVSQIDVTIDGADEVDLKKRMIKGRGAALLREKILASFSNEMIVMIDEQKKVEKLGKCLLPIEIVPYGFLATKKLIEKLGFVCNWRLDKDRKFLTDNGNFILDISFSSLLENPEEEHLKLLQVPGVIETGFFFNLANKVLVGNKEGDVRLI